MRDPNLPADRQDKRSVVPIELADADTWLRGSIDDEAKLIPKYYTLVLTLILCCC